MTSLDFVHRDMMERENMRDIMERENMEGADEDEDLSSEVPSRAETNDNDPIRNDTREIPSDIAAVGGMLRFAQVRIESPDEVQGCDGDEVASQDCIIRESRISSSDIVDRSLASLGGFSGLSFYSDEHE